MSCAPESDPHRTDKKACTKCDCIVEAPAPSHPTERGIAGSGLLARVLTGKCCEHLPLYRQSEIFARQRVELSHALLSNWVDACCQLMTPLNDALYRYVMNTRKVHTDDTPVKVLALGRKKQKQDASGRMSGMTGMRARQSHWRLGSPTHRTGRENIRYNTFVPSGVSCRRMRSTVTIGCSVPNVKAVH